MSTLFYSFVETIPNATDWSESIKSANLLITIILIRNQSSGTPIVSYLV